MLPVKGEQIRQTVDGYMGASMFHLAAEIRESPSDDIVQACAQLSSIEYEIVGQVIMLINQQGQTAIPEEWLNQIKKVACNAMQNFITRNCPVDAKSARTDEQLAALDILDQIYFVIDYLETFCCTGKPS